MRGDFKDMLVEFEKQIDRELRGNAVGWRPHTEGDKATEIPLTRFGSK
ncbi:hypothetical protein GCM10010833_23430 [Blastomonas aquatica]|uniref:Uncharacterized protein n=1 Tax=Blastomonas aquatica TaxID=1510276 RepID=A0ABQ1JIE4_9SPHN|nr:hypothetical protein GCM10010833_23430 [Blastomonas aquatica]